MTEQSTITRVDFRQHTAEEEYYQCLFEACDFSDTDLLHTDFDNCTFHNCNFNLCRVKTGMHNIRFVTCSMTGTDFSELPRFSNSFRFEDCQMNYANFSTCKLHKTTFQKCNLYEAYFNEADMTASVFEECNLERTSFFQANLERVDFSTAFNFYIDPNTCRLKKAIFSESELRGLVAHLNIIIR